MSQQEPTFAGGTNPALQTLARNWYRKFRPEYKRVWGRLNDIRRTWERSPRAERRGILKGSYVFTILTQRVDTDKAERTFELWLQGRTLRDAIDETGAGPVNQKLAWIYQSLWQDEAWETALDHIEADRITAAHADLMAQVTGVGAAKSGFLLANVGLTRKMCVDTNVARLLSIDPTVTGQCETDADCGGEDSDEICLAGQCAPPPEEIAGVSSIEEYEQLCGDVQQMFPELSKRLEPYQLQWLIFDMQRFYRIASSSEKSTQPVATHRVWFRRAINRPSLVANRAASLGRFSRRVHRVLERDPKYDAYNTLSSLIHWKNEGSDELWVVVEKARGPMGDDFETETTPGLDQSEIDALVQSIGESVDQSVDHQMIEKEAQSAVEAEVKGEST